MQNAETILIIILAIVLTIFLILAIALMVLVIKIVKSVNNVVNKAEHVIDTAGTAAEILKDQSGKLALFRIVRNIITIVNKDKEK